MKSYSFILCAVAVIGIPLTAFAPNPAQTETSGKAEGKPKAPSVNGEITAVSDTSITIAVGKTKETKVFKMDSATMISKEDNSAGTVADLVKGKKARVVEGASPDQAAKVRLLAPKAPGEGKEKKGKGKKEGGDKETEKKAAGAEDAE